MIRVFPRKTKWTPNDDLTFVGYPPLFRPPEQDVCISVTFTWDINMGYRLFKAWSEYYSRVFLGGPAFGDPGGEFIPGRFIKEGVTITSRGCPKCCPWCFVPKREGAIRELPIRSGWIVNDNNLLACSKKHIYDVFSMLEEVNGAVTFIGGIDANLLKEWHRTLFDKIKIKEIWLACDTKAALKTLRRSVKILDGISINKLRCYAMIGFNGESLAQAERRLETIYELGFLPFSQLYQDSSKKIYSKEWRMLARKWCRPAAYRSQNSSHTAAAKIEPL